MSSTQSGIFVADSDPTVFVQIRGRGTYRNAQPLRQWSQQAIERGCNTVHVDLAYCQGMDSTFLGVLAGIGLRLQKAGKRDGLHLFNADARSLNSCQSLGLERIATLETGEPRAIDLGPPPASDFRQLADTDLTTTSKTPDKTETAGVMLEAHEDLCRADERNEAKFKDVKQLLREDIARQTPNQKK